MQQSWRLLAADMEQQQRALQQHLQHPGTTHASAHAGLHLARLATLTGLLLHLWLACTGDLRANQGQPSAALS
mgnify:CR=1 FL=1